MIYSTRPTSYKVINFPCTIVHDIIHNYFVSIRLFLTTNLFFHMFSWPDFRYLHNRPRVKENKTAIRDWVSYHVILMFWLPATFAVRKTNSSYYCNASPMCKKHNFVAIYTWFIVLRFQNYCRMVTYQIHPDNESIDVYHSYRICPRIARGFWLVLHNSWVHEHVTSTLDYINIQKLIFI